jgi:hypothetical protein
VPRPELWMSMVVTRVAPVQSECAPALACASWQPLPNLSAYRTVAQPTPFAVVHCLSLFPYSLDPPTGAGYLCAAHLVSATQTCPKPSPSAPTHPSLIHSCYTCSRSSFEQRQPIPNAPRTLAHTSFNFCILQELGISVLRTWFSISI